jgi:transcriptional regulator with XRE-family HTH domain
MDTLGQRMKRERQRRVMTQGELAAAAKVALITVNRLENDTIENPRPATIRKLAGALGVDPAWLLFGDEEEKIAA